MRVTLPAWIALGALVAAGGWAVHAGRVGTGGVAVAWAGLLALFLRRSPGDGPPVVTMTVVALAVLIHVVSETLNLYAWGEWDTAQHFLLSFALGVLGFVLVRRVQDEAGAEPPVARAVAAAAAFLVVASAGVAWEIYEFSLDQAWEVGAQHGLFDTMLDLVAATSGGATAALVGWRFDEGGPLRPFHRDLAPLARASVAAVRDVARADG